MSNPFQQKARYLPSIISVKNILIFGALIDFVVTDILVSRRYEDMIANDINPAFPLIHFLVYPFLLLIACIGIRVNRGWSYLVAIAASLWLVIKIMSGWADIAQGYELPIFSRAAIEYWWVYEESYRWNIIRLPIAVFILLYSIISFLLLLRHHRKTRNEMLLSNKGA